MIKRSFIVFFLLILLSSVCHAWPWVWDEHIKKHEGFAQYPIITKNEVTIGYGHNLLAHGITKEIAEKILELDIEQAIIKAENLPYWNDLNMPRKLAITDMVFNLGYRGFLKFETFNTHMLNGEYHLAAQDMLDSKWAKQVGLRAIHNAWIIQFGEYLYEM